MHSHMHIKTIRFKWHAMRLKRGTDRQLNQNKENEALKEIQRIHSLS